MTARVQAELGAAIDLAREGLYRFLAAALSDPRSASWQLLQDADSQCLAREAADLLRAAAEGKSEPLGLGELPSAQLDLKPLLIELTRPADELRAEYDRVFGLVYTGECPPYETEYHPNAEPFFRAQQMADVAGFYRAFGLEPAHRQPERPDHVARELEFMAFVLLKKRLALAAGGPEAVERAYRCDEVQEKFFRDHLSWWLPAFATGLRRKAGTGFCAAVGRVLAAFLPLERSRFGLLPPRMPLQPAPTERPEEAADCAGCAVAG